SLGAIFFNAFFDYIGIKLVGAAGLPLSTAGVNIVAAFVMGAILQSKLGGLAWNDMLWDAGRMFGVTAIAGFLTHFIWIGSASLLSSPDPVSIVMRASVAGAIGLLVFTGGTLLLGISEVEQLRHRGRRMFES
ncbi:MAG: murein biosynthesis integral membrane protein MurJ, partial [Cyanobacteria bacterium J06648_11]